MRIFYTENDIEDLAASGARQLEVGPGVALTDAARERAEEIGIALVIPGSASASRATAPATAAPSGVAKAGTQPALPVRPRGCQHGPLGKSSRAEATPVAAGGGGGLVVDQLVDAVSALKKRGG